METTVTKTRKGIVLTERISKFQMNIDVQEFPETDTVGVRIRTNVVGMHEVFGTGVNGFYRIHAQPVVAYKPQSRRVVRRRRMVKKAA